MLTMQCIFDRPRLLELEELEVNGLVIPQEFRDYVKDNPVPNITQEVRLRIPQEFELSKAQYYESAHFVGAFIPREEDEFRLLPTEKRLMPPNTGQT